MRAADDDKHATVIVLCEEFLAVRTRHVGAWSVFSQSLLAVGKLSEALKAVDKTISLLRRRSEPEFLPWQFCRKGHVFREQGDYRSAIRWYSRASKVDPGEATFLIFAGLLHFKLGAYGKAVKTLTLATECSEGATDEAYYNLGVVRIAEGEYEKARSCFEQALAIDPKYAIAKKRLADVTSALRLG